MVDRMARTMLKRCIPLVALVPLVGCTQAQLAAWVQWHKDDPAAAIEFANRPEVQADLATGEHEDDDTQYTNYHAAQWERIAWCESGRQWDLRATNSTGTYGGGLMIRDNVWRNMGGQEFAPTADRATKEQQIEIAERILDDYGWNAWDCA